jgi:hypothetical protein
METAGVEPAPPRCKRGAPPSELHPLGSNVSDADGWSRTTTARGTAFTARGAHRLLSVRVHERQGGRPGSNRRRRGSQPRVLPLHHGHHESGDDRTRTGGLSPDKRVLCTSELRPRRVRGWDSNPRSRAHEAREDSRSSTAQVWPAGVEPAISGARSRRGAQLPHSQKTIVKPPAGLEPAASGLRARRHRHFDHGGICCRARWGSAGADPHRARSLKPAARAAGRGRVPAHR